MADSNITKKALAAAFRELMNEIQFSKISVRMICEKCDMNRKSFYYHFKDKYELVNWIFDTEFASADALVEDGSGWETLERVCVYFFDNRSFYKKIFKLDGQNSFVEHCRERLLPHLCEKVTSIMNSSDIPDFYINLFADFVICAVKRWLLDKNPLQPQTFVSLLKNLIESGAVYVCRSTIGNQDKE